MTETKGGPATTGRKSAARDRLLTTASRLFYTEGIRAVGVDRVMAEADIARGTFYRHFDGKDDLVRGYLDATDQDIRARVAVAAERTGGGAALLDVVAHSIGEQICGPGFRGCPFINAAAEYPDRGCPIHQAVLTHREWFRQLLEDTLATMGVADPRQSADLVVALRDGAMVAGYLGDSRSAARTLVQGVGLVVASG
ncbi:TetR/AcrR family transcriptional regulator [Actinacidiphila glaucinigra]|uniref:Transcriptional regulator, TetR family n=1 Tax=Actinacidiphila glaucinigra TaxID=235986 RepID=A0A239JU79_9ACTN|nr:TetR/AcrR family transcriptional regulator [Actinacidiphila glaucinigra]SNT08434.1 transcriptional regulator, TetR family [Actinacidiphila glaucinigra]